MTQPKPLLRVQRPAAGQESSLTWLVNAEGSDVAVTALGGESLHLRAEDHILDTLNLIADAAQGINLVRVDEPYTIECTNDVQAVLPLWLRVSAESGAAGAVADGHVVALEECASNLQVSFEHFMIVNGQQWAAWRGGSADSQPMWIAAPLRDDFIDDEYGFFDFTETGSMTSGRDVSRCGLITARAFAVVDRFDEGDPTYLSVRPATDPVNDLRHWLQQSELASQLSDIWPPFPDCDNFIEWGLLQLAKSGSTELTLWGAETDDEDDDPPMGLTSTSRWTFNCSLPSEQLRQALGEMLDVRPGKPNR